MATFFVSRELPEKLLAQIQNTVGELKSWKNAHVLIQTTFSQTNVDVSLSVASPSAGLEEAVARFKAHPALRITQFVIGQLSVIGGHSRRGAASDSQ